MIPANSGTTSLTRAEGLVLVADTPKGRGVIASKAIAKGTIVDVSPVLIFTNNEVEAHTSKTCLQHYTYYWPLPDGSPTQAVALGLGSMFNHSTLRQNVIWARNLQAQTIVYTAHRDIAAGEELCISYGHARLWFKDTDAVDEDDVYVKLQAMTGDDARNGLALAGFCGLNIDGDSSI